MQEEDIISRMRYGHVGLNSTFVIMRKHADGNCACGNQWTLWLS